MCPSLRSGGVGSCLVFERPSGSSAGWSFVTEILNSQPSAWDEFGSAADLAGDTAIAGVPGGDAAAFNAGGVAIHDRQAGGEDQWGFQRNLYASDPAAEHVFGWSIALSGDTLVVGAPTIAGADSGIGSAYVFERNAGGPDAWGLVRRLTASDSSDLRQLRICRRRTRRQDRRRGSGSRLERRSSVPLRAQRRRQLELGRGRQSGRFGRPGRSAVRLERGSGPRYPRRGSPAQGR